MENDLRYQVRSREIVDLVSAMRSERLMLLPYFQRNLVWRDTHRRDFIDTILKGYPFPQIFLARGPINLETMDAYQCVVDGQQRLNTIRDFVSDKLDVDGKLFSELSAKVREEFLKYEVPVIDFDLDAGDPRLKEIFHRLNRTFYSLTAIEKIASEYSASEFLLVARLLCGEITKDAADLEEELADIDLEAQAESEAENEEDAEAVGASNQFSRDPGISEETWSWLLERADGSFTRLVKSKNVFSNFEFDRKVPLMFTLTIMCTYLAGYFNRNDRVRKFLEDRNSEFPEKQELIDALNKAATFIEDMNLPQPSMWWNKANFFTLVCELMRNDALMGPGAAEVAARLLAFSQAVPQDYALAAREATGRKRERELRGTAVRNAIAGADAQ